MDLPELRYRDCPTVEVDLLIAASPDAVWAIVSDIEFPARHSSELQRVEWVDGSEGACLGAQFVGHNHHPAIGEWQTTSTVSEFEPGRIFGWAVGDPADPSASWRFVLTPEGDGTRLTQWLRMGPARSGINIAIDAMPDKESKILRRRFEEHRVNMLANLEGIKALAEASASGRTTES